MASPSAQPWAQLLVYRFRPGANFEGQLGGALQRIETGGALRILDAVFVGREPGSGELVAIDLKGGHAGGLVAPLVGFRLDPRERRKATERALAPGSKGLPPETLQRLGDTLEPGAAIAAVLVEHVWGRALDNAVARIGGESIAWDFIEARALAELTSELLAAAERT